MENTFVKHRMWFVALSSAIFMLAASSLTHAEEAMIVYKNAYCGCCAKWAEHIQRAGFEVTVVNVNDLGSVNANFAIPQKVAACHTAKLGSYYIVGHVPVADILKLLEEKPHMLGLSVPGMPMGSPGMEVKGRPTVKYESVLFTGNGETKVYVSH